MTTIRVPLIDPSLLQIACELQIANFLSVDNDLATIPKIEEMLKSLASDVIQCDISEISKTFERVEVNVPFSGPLGDVRAYFDVSRGDPVAALVLHNTLLRIVVAYPPSVAAISGVIYAPVDGTCTIYERSPQGADLLDSEALVVKAPALLKKNPQLNDKVLVATYRPAAAVPPPPPPPPPRPLPQGVAESDDRGALLHRQLSSGVNHAAASTYTSSPQSSLPAEFRHDFEDVDDDTDVQVKLHNGPGKPSEHREVSRRAGAESKAQERALLEAALTEEERLDNETRRVEAEIQKLQRELDEAKRLKQEIDALRAQRDELQRENGVRKRQQQTLECEAAEVLQAVKALQRNATPRV